MFQFENVLNEIEERNIVPINQCYGGARGVMVIVVGHGHGDSSSILDETDCISHGTNTFGKGMNPIILPPAMGK